MRENTLKQRLYAGQAAPFLDRGAWGVQVPHVNTADEARAAVQTVVDFTHELLQNRTVSRPTFDAAAARFGPRGTMTLTNLIACYAVLAYNMNTYDLEAPAHPTEKALSQP